MKLGYACINLSLEKDGIRANRSMIQKTFQSKGLKYVSELVIQNLHDLRKIIMWNINNNIHAYRIPDDLFPWKSNYNIEDLPDFNIIKKILGDIGNLCREHNHRLSFHPGPFNVLASPDDDVVLKTINELDKHSQIFDLMDFEPDHNTKINIHVGGAYGNKQLAMDRFCDNFTKLHTNTQKRLTVENDDKKNMYTIQDLMYIHNNIGIPLVFDYHHFTLHNDGYSHKETLELAMSTWKDAIPVIHHSSPKPLYEAVDDKKVKMQAHADYIYEKCETFGYDVVIMLESKAKDLSVLKYRKDFI